MNETLPRERLATVCASGVTGSGPNGSAGPSLLRSAKGALGFGDCFGPGPVAADDVGDVVETGVAQHACAN